jgi:uncharacterized membrane protein (DUF485 family)
MTDTAHLPATFGGITPGAAGGWRNQSESGPADRPGGADLAGQADRPDFTAIRRSPQFGALRSSHRRFVFTMSALFLLWYVVYVLLAAYARGFMSTRVAGLLNMGLLLGLGQFVSTVAITAGYLYYARRRIDPKVAAITASVEAGSA